MTTRRHIEDNIPDELLAYLAEDHQAEKDELLGIWSMCEGAHATERPDPGQKAAVRHSVLNAIEEISESRTIWSPLQLVSIRGYAVAATLALLVAASFTFSPDGISLRAPVGSPSTTEYDLPDGSHVVLAAGSLLSYSESFGNLERRIALKGEAFFDVTASDVPFVIDTYNARTTVHGTRFSVRAWANDILPDTDVRVLEGRVSVSPRHRSSWALFLEAGDEFSVGRDVDLEPEPTKAVADGAFAWLRGGYEYKNEPIGNVLADLKRQFGSVVEAPVTVKLRPISIFNQSASSLEAILGDISATVGVKYRAISGGYELYDE